MEKRRTPQPNGYCPVLHRAHLPIDTQVVLPTYGAQHEFVRVVDRCLCNSVAHMDIPCDPVRCTIRLTESMQWAMTTEKPIAAFGGCCKRIFREYNEDRIAAASKPSTAVADFMAELFFGDDDD